NDERERRPRRDELDELSEERLLTMLRVMRFAELTVDANELSGAERAAPLLDPRQDLTGQTALHRVRLDQDQGLLDRHSEAHVVVRPSMDMVLAHVTWTRSVLDCHERRSLLRAAPASGRSRLERRELDRRRLDRRLAVRADLPERLERCLAVHARLFQL